MKGKIQELKKEGYTKRRASYRQAYGKQPGNDGREIGGVYAGK
jgi:hypothetical protein